jgi:hypothetical protein
LNPNCFLGMYVVNFCKRKDIIPKRLQHRNANNNRGQDLKRVTNSQSYMLCDLLHLLHDKTK